MNTPDNHMRPVSERYRYRINPDDGSAAAAVLSMTGSDKRVLELGPGPGTILRHLAEFNRCRVSAVELDADCAAQLQDVCELVVQADLDQDNWLTALAGQQFDVIVAADVLEHLKDPWRCLEKMQSLLTPGGYLVISIPNVGHHSVLAALLAGRFPYQERGLLDRTHLRFFTRHDFENLLYQSGYLPSQWFAVQKPVMQAELGYQWAGLQSQQQELLCANPYGNDYQYVVRAYASDTAGSVARARLLADQTEAANVQLQQEQQRLLQLLAERQHQLDNAELKISDQVKLFAEQHQHYQGLLKDQQQQAQTSLAEAGQQQRVYQSEIERLNEHLQQVNSQLQQANGKIEEIWASTSWKLTRPVRAIRKLIGGVSLRSQLRDTYRALPEPVRQALDKTGVTASIRNQVPPASSVMPVPQLPGWNPFIEQGFGRLAGSAEDVIFWGVIDWNFRFQRPQQLALGFSQRGHRVFYVSSELINHSEPGYQIEAIAGQQNVYQIRFYAKSAPAIYHHQASHDTLRQLRAGFGKLLADANCQQAISIVQHPFWLPLARHVPASHFVYDCMDHHEGFGNCLPEIIDGERALMRESDTLIVTSDWLYNVAHEKNPNTYIVRNACEFSHFNRAPANIYRDQQGRRIIGYFGAIADWFDCDIVQAVARHFKDDLILLVGNDTCGAAKKLSGCKNIVFTGEVPYQQLPFYLHAFDVCILPFQIIDLTLATNPVKVYEYLSAGKPVVSVQLPELKSMQQLVYLADDAQQFIAHCETALAESAADPVLQQRIEFASQQTWQHRAAELETAISSSSLPLVSVVVVTYNNLDLTKKCLASVDAHTSNVRYEIIIVDNASSDGSPEYLSEFAAGRDDVVLVLNQDNTGFSKANNQGLALAKGDYLVVLNNDTVVTSGWAAGLIRHCKQDPLIGLIGPVTNNIGNEAKIDIHYESLDDMPAQARNYTLAHLGQSLGLRTLAFFCVMLTRNTYQKIGGLDEAFGLGFFEDDDYCRRVEQAGLRIVCADDVFVHHNLSASFNKLGEERKQALFVKNKAIYEEKWGKWIPHSYRT